MRLFDRTSYSVVKPGEEGYTSLRFEKKQTLVYSFYFRNRLTYILLPAVERRNVPTIECYKVEDGAKLKKVKSRKIIKALAEPYMKRFLASLRQLVNAVNSKIAIAEERGYAYNIIVPKMGAWFLYILMNKFFGTNWKKVIYVNYTKSSEASHRKRMRKALKPHLEAAFRGKWRGYSLIIIDEFVSGTSIDTIFKDFLATLDEDLGINFALEKKYYHDLLLKKYNIFFQRVSFLRDEIELRSEYAYFYEQLIDFILGNIEQGKVSLLKKSKTVDRDFIEYVQTYTLELETLLFMFKDDFYEYLSEDEKKLFEYLSSVIKSHAEKLHQYLELDLAKNKLLIAFSMRTIVESYRKIIDISVKTSLISIAIGRRVYQEWLAAFNIQVCFVTISDASKHNEEIFATKRIYYDLFKRNLVERFSSIGIPTMDILTSQEQIKLEKIEGLPSNLEGMPKLNEIVKFLELFID